MIRICEFRALLDIEAAVRQHVELKRKGKTMTGLCPFHSEKTPSFKVSTERQRFKCFGCGAHGDVIDFYQKLLGLSLMDACAQLANEQGIDLDGVTTTVTERGRKLLQLAKSEAPAFDAWITCRLDHINRQIEGLWVTGDVRREMARHVEKLASGGIISPEDTETMRDAWFAQIAMTRSIEAEIERLEREAANVELRTPEEVSRFLRVFYSDPALRVGLEQVTESKKLAEHVPMEKFIESYEASERGFVRADTTPDGPEGPSEGDRVDA